MAIAILSCILITCLAILALIVLLAALFYRKLRATIRRVGSFRCSYRPDIHSGWTEGVAVYQTEAIVWHRLVSLSTKPQREWSRRNMRITHVSECGCDERGQLVELRIHADGHRFFLAMSQADYTGLVAWIDAGPPRSASFL